MMPVAEDVNDKLSLGSFARPQIRLSGGVSEKNLLLNTLWGGQQQEVVGGEGVLYIQAIRSQGGGYWMLSMFSLKGRAITRGPILIQMCYTIFIVTVLETAFGMRMRTSASGLLFSGLSTGLSVIGTALFFLQTFRTNSAYQRWWEGRCLWGQAVTEIQAISRTVSSGAVKHRALARSLLRWAAAYVLTLKAGFRGEDEMEEVGDVVLGEDRAKLQSVPPAERTLYCLERLQAAWGDAQDLGPAVLRRCADTEMERVLPVLMSSMMGMRRIMTTPMPFAYISHLRTFLAVWLALLPLAQVYYMGYWAIAMCGVIGYALLGMEAISLEIECPFGRDFNDLPVDNLALEVLSVLRRAFDRTATLPDVRSERDTEFGAGLEPETSSPSFWTPKTRNSVMQPLLV